MKDDFYHNYKEHKISQNTISEVSSRKEPLQIIDPRPRGIGQENVVGRSRKDPFPRQEGSCFYCGRILDFALNKNYDSSVRGYCSKLCRKDHETQLIQEGRLLVRDLNRPVQPIKSGESETNWAKGWWENIASEPVYIQDKTHLKEVCEKHGVMAKALIKPKTSGKGWEMR